MSRLPRYWTIVSALSLFTSCAGRPLKAADAIKGSASGSLTKQEWCSKVEQFKDSPDWQCTWPPGRCAPGDYGPISNISRNSILGTVFDRGDPLLTQNFTVRKVGSVSIETGKTVTLGAKLHFDLRKLSTFAPEVHISTDIDTTATLDFTLEDAEWRFYQNISAAIADGLRDPGGDERRTQRLKQARQTMCLESGALVEGVLVGKLSVTIKAHSAGGVTAKLGWSKAGLDVHAGATSDGTIVVKNTAEPVAVLYLVNPTRPMLAEFNQCDPPAK